MFMRGTFLVTRVKIPIALHVGNFSSVASATQQKTGLKKGIAGIVNFLWMGYGHDILRYCGVG